MAIVDYIIILITVISIVISLFRGFVKEALSLGTWAASVFVALTFANKGASLMPETFAQPSIRLGLAFIGLFVATMIVGGLVKFLVGGFISKTGLSSADRAIGIIFGFLRGILIVCVLVMLANLTPMPNDPWWKASMFLPYFIELVDWLEPFLPDFLH